MYVNAYGSLLGELKVICPNACVFKPLPELNEEEIDRADSQGDGFEEELSIASNEDEECEVSILNLNQTATFTNTTLPSKPRAISLNRR